MAKRLFFETKLYDYTTKQQAEEDIIEMRKKGWVVKDSYAQDDYNYSWTVEYMKQH